MSIRSDLWWWWWWCSRTFCACWLQFDLKRGLFLKIDDKALCCKLTHLTTFNVNAFWLQPRPSAATLSYSQTSHVFMSIYQACLWVWEPDYSKVSAVVCEEARLGAKCVVSWGQNEMRFVKGNPDHKCVFFNPQAGAAVIKQCRTRHCSCEDPTHYSRPFGGDHTVCRNFWCAGKFDKQHNICIHHCTMICSFLVF